MPSSPTGGIFLSYRREDAAPYARLLQQKLRERLPSARVFMDLDSIEPGMDFAEVIEEAVSSCDILVAIIGRQWVALTDEQGRPRLEDPHDFVRFEIQAALRRGVRLIPVLVDGAGPLRQQQLPGELQKLARLNALELSYGRYEYDVGRLVELIERVLAAAPVELVASAATQRPNTAQKDPRATRLLAQGLQIAYSITNQRQKIHKVMALAAVAKAMAATDPVRAARAFVDAEATAESITSQYDRPRALAAVGRALAATDPDRAARLITMAEDIAWSISDEGNKAWQLAEVTQAIAAINSDQAERIAQSMPDSFDHRPKAFAAVASAMAVSDPDRAEGIAQSITDIPTKAWALANVAQIVAPADPLRAAHLVTEAESAADAIPADRLTAEFERAWVLASGAKAVAATDPARAARLITDAERTAYSIPRVAYKVKALASVAEAVAATDPAHAARLITDAEGIAEALPDGSLDDKFQKSEVLTTVAKTMAATNASRAELIAQPIISELDRVLVLVAIAEASSA
jgi:TIR domain